jgi:hypothetical protein
MPFWNSDDYEIVIPRLKRRIMTPLNGFMHPFDMLE